MNKAFFFSALAILSLTACKNTKEEGQLNNTVAVEVEKPVHLTKQMFIDKIMDYESNSKEWKYKGNIPCIVDFYADWCKPCKITSPILDELAKEYSGKIQFYKVDVDAEKELANAFGIQSIPTFLFVPLNGNPTISSGIAQTPEQTKEMFKQQIETLLLTK